MLIRVPAAEKFYLEGEERFGPLLSRLYGAFTPFGMDYYRFVAKDLISSGADSFLDVGTGNGIVPSLMANKTNSKIYCIDPSKDMVAIAHRKNSAFGNVIVGRGSSRYVPFRKKFGVIFSSLSYHHWARKAESLLYLSRFLTNSGELRIYEYNRDKAFFFSKALAGKHMSSVAMISEDIAGTGLHISARKFHWGYMRISIRK